MACSTSSCATVKVVVGYFIFAGKFIFELRELSVLTVPRYIGTGEGQIIHVFQKMLIHANTG